MMNSCVGTGTLGIIGSELGFGCISCMMNCCVGTGKLGIKGGGMGLLEHGSILCSGKGALDICCRLINCCLYFSMSCSRNCCCCLRLCELTVCKQKL